jgi:hypothetical protein
VGIRGNFTGKVMFRECFKTRVGIHKTEKRMGSRHGMGEGMSMVKSLGIKENIKP